ncbi:hypothetical protein ABKN59_000190 [Abortiporus biennis]
MNLQQESQAFQKLCDVAFEIEFTVKAARICLWKYLLKMKTLMSFPLPEIQSASVLNELILQAGKDLAREGKRVSDVPKYLVDGIVIPWILDFSVVESDVETSIRSLIAYSKKDYCSDNEDDVAPPVSIQSHAEHEGSSSAQQYTQDIHARKSPTPPHAPYAMQLANSISTSDSITSTFHKHSEDVSSSFPPHLDVTNNTEPSPPRLNDPERNLQTTLHDKQSLHVEFEGPSINPPPLGNRKSSGSNLASLYGDFYRSDSDSASSDNEDDLAFQPVSYRRPLSPAVKDDILTKLLDGRVDQRGIEELQASLPQSQHLAPISLNHRSRPPRITRKGEKEFSPHGHTRIVSEKRKRPVESSLSTFKRRRSYSLSTSSGSESEEYDQLDSDMELENENSEDEDIYNARMIQGEQGKTIYMPEPNFTRGRRLIVPASSDKPMVCIYMRGDAQFISQNRLCRLSAFSLPADDTLRGVRDACLIDYDKAVVGYQSTYPNPQISILDISSKAPRRFNISHRGHSTVTEHRMKGNTTPNEGICSLAKLDSARFLTGGYDKTIRIWNIKSTNGRSGYTTTSESLDIRHASQVDALVHRSTDNTIFSASGKMIFTSSLERAQQNPLNQTMLSNTICQIHVRSDNPPMTIIEVDHLDDQIHIYDSRKSGFDRKPCLQFGHRDTGNRHGSKLFKGDTIETYFGRGYSDGTVGLWDYRSLKNPILRTNTTRQGKKKKVTHTVLTPNLILAYGGSAVTVWDRSTFGVIERRFLQHS